MVLVTSPFQAHVRFARARRRAAASLRHRATHPTAVAGPRAPARACAFRSLSPRAATNGGPSGGAPLTEPGGLEAVDGLARRPGGHTPTRRDVVQSTPSQMTQQNLEAPQRQAHLPADLGCHTGSPSPSRPVPADRTPASLRFRVRQDDLIHCIGSVGTISASALHVGDNLAATPVKLPARGLGGRRAPPGCWPPVRCASQAPARVRHNRDGNARAGAGLRTRRGRYPSPPSATPRRSVVEVIGR